MYSQSPNSNPNAGRSLPCNGKLISQLRKQLGWTKGELAQRAGFSERLIVKAEAGQNLASSTVHIIALALGEAGLDLCAGDLAADPAALAREFFLSTYKHGPRTLDVHAHFISPHLVVHFQGTRLCSLSLVRMLELTPRVERFSRFIASSNLQMIQVKWRASKSFRRGMEL